MRFTPFVLLLFLLFSCKNSGKKKELQLNRSQFEQCLEALHIYEGYLGVRDFANDSITLQQQAGYDSIFNHYQLSREQFFDEYNRYLRYYPEDLDSIYKQLSEELEMLVDSAQGPKMEHIIRP